METGFTTSGGTPTQARGAQRPSGRPPGRRDHPRERGGTRCGNRVYNLRRGPPARPGSIRRKRYRQHHPRDHPERRHHAANGAPRPSTVPVRTYVRVMSSLCPPPGSPPRTASSPRRSTRWRPRRARRDRPLSGSRCSRCAKAPAPARTGRVATTATSTGTCVHRTRLPQRHPRAGRPARLDRATPGAAPGRRAVHGRTAWTALNCRRRCRPRPRVRPGRHRTRACAVIATVLSSGAARRVDPDRRRRRAADRRPRPPLHSRTSSRTWATRLIEKLDEDGPEPDDDLPQAAGERAEDRPEPRPVPVGGSAAASTTPHCSSRRHRRRHRRGAAPTHSIAAAPPNVRPRRWPRCARTPSSTATSVSPRPAAVGR